MDAVQFHLGQAVYWRLDAEKSGMVTGIMFRPAGVIFGVTWSHTLNEQWHWAVELTADKNYVAEREER
jgi:hypothetical protein